MSGTVDITHGGAICVDPEALRAVGRTLLRIAPQFATACAAIRRAYGHTLAVPGIIGRVDMGALWASGDRVAVMGDQCRSAGQNTLLMADVYELVETRARLEALAVRDGAEADPLFARITELEASDPRVTDMATWLVSEWEAGRFEGLTGQQLQIAGQMDLTWLFLLVAGIGGSGLGTIRQGANLSGSGDPVWVTPVKSSAPIAPPTSLAEAFRRFPSTDGAQFKVEKYTMADGTSRFVLYAKGTESPWWGRENPLDMKSNVELYTGSESASYLATLEVLEAAGAQPGDQVDVYAHSQAAINAAYLASQSEFDVKVQVTAGSPVHPILDDDQLLIELRHTDDIVSTLAGGGAPGGSGSPDSFVASRVGDPQYSPHDLALKTHYLDTYIETAEMVDASGDVRLQAIEENWRELNEAVSIESTEYEAQRQ